MTKLGEYLAAKSVNKSEVARRTGLSKARVNQLTLNDTTKLRADELYLIALAIDVKPIELLEYVCEGVKLVEVR
ncbi:helix-turn-helix domain-containing protein [Niabella soli]|uniref:DNA-binding protein n=1 Tax=Niabella soli DSM 19437 TaxID=929713 RepID=W0F3T1_9BACT|nr:helix-turn-helix transcriptional regulator [Niabella soli]AHF16468.1 DNA-binding protein [Niabella soli DSM 19437]